MGTCRECYQQKVCERRDSPISLGGPEIIEPQQCFFYVCPEGLLAALHAIRSHVSDPEPACPFGTSHKPFTSSKLFVGRTVYSQDSGERKRGDVTVKIRGEEFLLTNVFQYKPPR